MATQNALSIPVSAQQRYRITATDSFRRRALERLYARRCAVDQLIESLERYQSAQSSRRANCIEITSAPTSTSKMS
jgi:hypothetical protein